MDRSINDGLDYSGDAAAGSFFSSDYKRHDDLKQMLDSNRDNLKLEAMKRIIGMVAKGRDASELFPAVVKNVVSKNTEVKKLVYVYLVRYAEEQQDLALLSISTFQRALKDPNQLIRASALRVLSSIRVPMIAPIVMLAIRDSAADMSAYVRKTAAHAIPKLYSLDPDQKDELVTILDKLLSDRTTLVVGSAVMAFEEVCPERNDLVHKNYRKLCALLMDVDEWGQIVILNMLTRYARTQFLDPNIGDLTIDGEERPFYEDEKEESEESDTEQKNDEDKASKAKAAMDSDHRLLLKNSKPLLQSRNAAVVMAVAQLYYHCAPRSEVPVVVKALVRLLRSHSEVQAVVLTCIAAMSTERKSLFEPYLKSFYVRSSDPTQIKLLKLEILTNIANETNIPPILREFQTYISSHDKEFVAASIQAIGRCASNIKQVAETCLNGLVSLLSHRDPAVVGGAVVVAKTLLQSQKSGTKPVITQLAKMVDRVTVPPARAAILWLLGEHCERLPHLPPDVLRKMAKTFPDEDDIVKLQIINLAAKLHLTNPKQTTLLCQYVLNLARYDQSYDIRDRARFIRHLLFPENPDSKLTKYAKKILLSSKPAPVLQSKYKDRDHFQLGSMSHFLNTRAAGYQDLPGYPEEAPDPTVRNVEPPPSSVSSDTKIFDLDIVKKNSKKKPGKGKGKGRSFYSDSEGSGKSGSGSESESGSGSESSSGTEDSESDSEDSKSGSGKSLDSADEGNVKEDVSKKKVDSTTSNGVNSNNSKKQRKVVRYNRKEVITDSESEESSNENSETSSESEPESDDDKKEEPAKSSNHKQSSGKRKDAGNNAAAGGTVDMLLDLEDVLGNANSSISMSPTPASAMSVSISPSQTNATTNFQRASPAFIPNKLNEILTKIVSGGLQVSYRFTRSPSIYSQKMISVELQFQNLGKDPVKEIRINQHMLSSGIKVHDFQPISQLGVNENSVASIGIDFNDTTQGAKLELAWGTEVESRKHTVTINAPVGELIQAVSMSESVFISEQGKLKGMNEHESKISIKRTLLPAPSSYQSLTTKIYETANLLQVPSTEDNLLRFAGQSVSSGTLVLVTMHFNNTANSDADGPIEAKVVVNCEKIVVGSMLLQEIKELFK